MRIDIISAVPALLESPFNHSILQRAKDRNIVDIHIHNLREYGLGKHYQIDDYQFGGGAGMVMMAEPLDNCISSLKAKFNYDEIVYLTPDGLVLRQSLCNQLSLYQSLLLVCGHYKGIDERIREMHITLEVSIGDYVLSGGELGAAVLVDSIVRIIPGVLNNESSALFDSFQDGILAPPVYTRPSKYKGRGVPDVLLSGHDLKIGEWRYSQSMERTQKRRPDLLD
ncbi:MAG: tRNA (guanosine(37)-N1)-methyltransferase TrmD [Saprospiraceae bacterium]